MSTKTFYVKIWCIFLALNFFMVHISFSYGQNQITAPSPRLASLKTYADIRHFSTITTSLASPGGHLYAETRIDGSDLRFLIDTGAIYSVIDPTVATNLRRLSPEKFKASDITLNDPDSYWLTSFFIGDLYLRNFPLRSCRCKEFLDKDIRRAGGILGLDLFEKNHLILNFQHDSIFVDNNGLPCSFLHLPKQVARNANLMDIMSQNHFVKAKVYKSVKTYRWYVKMELNRKECLFLLDSGSINNFLFPESAKRIGYTPNKTLITDYVTSLSGPLRRYNFLTPEAKFVGLSGSTHLQIWVCESPLADDEADDEFIDGKMHCDGILGLQFLRQFGTVFDFSSTSLYIHTNNLLPFDSSLDGEWEFVSYSDGDIVRTDLGTKRCKWLINNKNLKFFTGTKSVEYRIQTFPWKHESWIDLIGLDTPQVALGIFKVKDDIMTVSISLNNTYRPTNFVAKQRESSVIKLKRKQD